MNVSLLYHICLIKSYSINWIQHILALLNSIRDHHHVVHVSSLMHLRLVCGLFTQRLRIQLEH